MTPVHLVPPAAAPPAHPARGIARTRAVRGIAAVGVALAVLCAAGVALERLEGAADTRRDLEFRVAALQARMREISALEWQSIASGRIGRALERDLAARHGALDADLGRLRSSGLDRAAADEIRARALEYEEAVRAEVALLRAGRVSEARDLDRTRVDPGYDALQAALGRAEDRLAAAVTRTRRLARAGAWLVMILALGAIAGLAALAHRRARRAEVAEAERRAWRESEQRYRELFEANPNPMWVAERGSGRLLAVNEAALRLYGYDRQEFLALTVARLHAEGTRCSKQEWFTSVEGEFSPASRCRHARRDGAPIEVEVTASRLHFEDRPAAIALVQDVTGRLRLEEQAREAQRLEAVARLAGGVAHEFNNLLTTIGGYAQLLRPRFAPEREPRTASHVREILHATEKGGALVQQLLAFGRRQLTMPRALDLSRLLEERRSVLQRLAGAGAVLEIHGASSLGPVWADPAEIEQVIVNLVVNAADAMPHGGRITVETAEVRLDAAALRDLPGAQPGAWVRLSVRDEGAGMDEATRARAFEPFFTTKGPGAGAGLGLSAVHGIVHRLGGFITVATAPGRGSTFRVHLPRGPETPALEPLSGEGAALAGDVVLVVEDDPAVRALVREMLLPRGYQVLEAENGREALDLARGIGEDRIRLLISDVVMPEMGGRALAEAMLQRVPGLRVIFMSGHPDDAILREEVAAGRATLLPKPFREEQLLGTVRRALQEPGDRAA